MADTGDVLRAAAAAVGGLDGGLRTGRGAKDAGGVLHRLQREPALAWSHGIAVLAGSAGGDPCARLVAGQLVHGVLLRAASHRQPKSASPPFPPDAAAWEPALLAALARAAERAEDRSVVTQLALVVTAVVYKRPCPSGEEYRFAHPAEGVVPALVRALGASPSHAVALLSVLRLLPEQAADLRLGMHPARRAALQEALARAAPAVHERVCATLAAAGGAASPLTADAMYALARWLPLGGIGTAALAAGGLLPLAFAVLQPGAAPTPAVLSAATEAVAEAVTCVEAPDVAAASLTPVLALLAAAPPAAPAAERELCAARLLAAAGAHWQLALVEVLCGSAAAAAAAKAPEAAGLPSLRDAGDPQVLARLVEALEAAVHHPDGDVATLALDALDALAALLPRGSDGAAPHLADLALAVSRRLRLPPEVGTDDADWDARIVRGRVGDVVRSFLQAAAPGTVLEALGAAARDAAADPDWRAPEAALVAVYAALRGGCAAVPAVVAESVHAAALLACSREPLPPVELHRSAIAALGSIAPALAVDPVARGNATAACAAALGRTGTRWHEPHAYSVPQTAAVTLAKLWPAVLARGEDVDAAGVLAATHTRLRAGWAAALRTGSPDPLEGRTDELLLRVLAARAASLPSAAEAEAALETLLAPVVESAAGALRQPQGGAGWASLGADLRLLGTVMQHLGSAPPAQARGWWEARAGADGRGAPGPALGRLVGVALAIAAAGRAAAPDDARFLVAQAAQTAPGAAAQHLEPLLAAEMAGGSPPAASSLELMRALLRAFAGTPSVPALDAAVAAALAAALPAAVARGTEEPYAAAAFELLADAAHTRAGAVRRADAEAALPRGVLLLHLPCAAAAAVRASRAVGAIGAASGAPLVRALVQAAEAGAASTKQGDLVQLAGAALHVHRSGPASQAFAACLDVALAPGSDGFPRASVEPLEVRGRVDALLAIGERVVAGDNNGVRKALRDFRKRKTLLP